eukprot:366000-Chlamydomonas_euryale.AAC.61
MRLWCLPGRHPMLLPVSQATWPPKPGECLQSIKVDRPSSQQPGHHASARPDQAGLRRFDAVGFVLPAGCACFVVCAVAGRFGAAFRPSLTEPSSVFAGLVLGAAHELGRAAAAALLPAWQCQSRSERTQHGYFCVKLSKKLKKPAQDSKMESRHAIVTSQAPPHGRLVTKGSACNLSPETDPKNSSKLEKRRSTTGPASRQCGQYFYNAACIHTFILGSPL